MSRPLSRRRSDHDSRTLPLISTPRAHSCTPVHPLRNHLPHSARPPSAANNAPTSSTVAPSERPPDLPRSIPYLDAETLSRLLSPDRAGSVPPRRYVLSDLGADRLPRSLHADPQPVASAWQRPRYNVRPLPGLRPTHSRPPNSSSKPSGISWHRPRSDPRVIQSSTPTTATTSGAATPTVHETTTPVSPTRISTRRKDRNLANASGRRAASVIGNEHLAPAPGLSLVNDKLTRQNSRKARRSSYLGAAFSSRKLSALGWIPDHLRDIPPDSVFDHQPIHPIVQLAPFGHHWSHDVVSLYTNSLRTELNDLIFLIGCLQHSLADPLKKKDRHKTLEIDFRQWYHWFAQFSVQIFRAFEDFFFPLVTELLEQRDVMVSRSTAVSEAKGVSYPQAWSITTSDLFQKMETVRDLLSTVHDRLFRLQQKPGDAEDAARATLWYATFDTVANLIPVAVDLLTQLDHSIAAILALKLETRKGLRKMSRQFAVLMIREGSPPLGWSAVTALTRCIKDRKLRSEHVSALSRAARQSIFSRYRADNSHHNIVKKHRIRVYDEQRRGS